MKNVELEKYPIYLGCVEEEGNFKQLTLCTELSDGKSVNLENFQVYPKLEYKVERGIIHYTKVTLMKMIDLTYLLTLLNYSNINQLKEQLTTSMLSTLIHESSQKFYHDKVNYLKEIYYLLEMDESRKKDINSFSKIKKNTMVHR